MKGRKRWKNMGQCLEKESCVSCSCRRSCCKGKTGEREREREGGERGVAASAVGLFVRQAHTRRISRKGASVSSLGQGGT